MRTESFLGQPLYVAKRVLRRCQRNRDTALHHLNVARDLATDPEGLVICDYAILERIEWAIESLNKQVEDR